MTKSLISILMVAFATVACAAGTTDFQTPFDGTAEGWTLEPAETWLLEADPYSGVPRLSSLGNGEEGTGVARSAPFVIEGDMQRFRISGADGTATTTNSGDSVFVYLRSYPDGEILRTQRPPGTHFLTRVQWHTPELLGREVYLEVIDNNPKLHPGGFAWVGIADYKQETVFMTDDMAERDDLYGLRIDPEADRVSCRSIPFLYAPPNRRQGTTRVVDGARETIPVGTEAKALFLLGMVNGGWDAGLAHWGEHPELRTERPDQVYIGVELGSLEVHYASGTVDVIPLVVGQTMWFAAQWSFGPSHGQSEGVREPVASRPDIGALFERSMKLRENQLPATLDTQHAVFYLAVEPRPEPVERLVVVNNDQKRGRPDISGITLVTDNPGENAEPFGRLAVAAGDLEPVGRTDNADEWMDAADRDALADALYMSASDLPADPEPWPWQEGLEGARIEFLGGREAQMLTNVWNANMATIDEKFSPETGVFYESLENGPWYGGYSGIGTWSPVGVYRAAFSRCTDHYATLALRLLHDEQRLTSFVDFMDDALYFYRDNRDPEKGPPNGHLDVENYPADAPPHWSFTVPAGGPPWQINEIPGDEETDGHGATMVARWMAWRNLGAPDGDWLTAPREHVYGHSRYDSTRDAAEFICWLMDYTGMDVVYCEGETTGWAGGPHTPLIDGRVRDEKDPHRRRQYYANADMYEIYPSYVCWHGLLCSAEMAEAAGDMESAERWRAYASRLRAGMLRLLVQGEHGSRTWRQSPYSTYPSLQDSLVTAWFAFYRDGIDASRLPPDMVEITRNTLERQLSYPYGLAPVLAMGYGQGWLGKSALVLDEMDAAGELLVNIALYSYDKNMDYVDEERGIDWRRFMWLIPEGTNILPDGRWHRIGDLTNGANQGPSMHAMEIAAGVEDARPDDLRILPRTVEPLDGVRVTDHPVLLPAAEGLGRTLVAYEYHRPGGRFTLSADDVLPNLSVRMGPWDEAEAMARAANASAPNGGTVRVERMGTYRGGPAYWVWFEGMRDVSSVELLAAR